jgi:hypothetical protein
MVYFRGDLGAWSLSFNGSPQAKDERSLAKAKAELSTFNFERFKSTAAPGFNGSKSSTFR